MKGILDFATMMVERLRWTMHLNCRARARGTLPNRGNRREKKHSVHFQEGSPVLQVRWSVGMADFSRTILWDAETASDATDIALVVRTRRISASFKSDDKRAASAWEEFEDYGDIDR